MCKMTVRISSVTSAFTRSDGYRYTSLGSTLSSSSGRGCTRWVQGVRCTRRFWNLRCTRLSGLDQMRSTPSTALCAPSPTRCRWITRCHLLKPSDYSVQRPRGLKCPSGAKSLHATAAHCRGFPHPLPLSGFSESDQPPEPIKSRFGKMLGGVGDKLFPLNGIIPPTDNPSPIFNCLSPQSTGI